MIKILVTKIHQTALGKLDFVTSSIEKFGHMDYVTLEDVIGSLKVYEETLQDQEA